VLTLIRHLIAIAVLPVTMALLIPLWIVRRNHIVLGLGTSAIQVAGQAAGVVFLGVGLLLFASSLRLFAVDGGGTLAPWDPPKSLVARGPYRYVRNPMISGVLFIVFGEALVLRSPPHFVWALCFLCMNLVYIPLLEEPQLAQRFGDAYREYRAHVPRFIPRARPWRPREVDSAHMGRGSLRTPR
jgi:protein-S-isoprenylcysteine O-methyltransferase Ste14